MTLLRQAAQNLRLTTLPWVAVSDGTIPSPGQSALSTAGVSVTPRTSMQQIDVWSCTTHLGDQIAGLPTGVFRSTTRQTDGRTVKVREEIPPPTAMFGSAGPDPETNSEQWMFQAVWSMVLAGEAIGLITGRSKRNNVPTGVILFDPAEVRHHRSNSGQLLFDFPGQKNVTRRDVLHIPLYQLPGSVRGLSPIGAHMRLIGMTIATEEFGARWYAEGSAPSAVLETDKPLDQDETVRIQARWLASHAGKRVPAVMSGGLKYKPVSIKPNESQFLESRAYNSLQISKLFRVPPQILGDTTKSTSFGKGLEELGIWYVVYSLQPLFRRIEAEFTRHLPAGQYFRVNPAGLLRSNIRDRYQSYAVARMWGWLSVNDIRALEDLPPIDGGDIYLQPVNMVDASQALDLIMKSDSGIADALGVDDLDEFTEQTRLLAGLP